MIKTIGEVSTVRTGVVAARKKVNKNSTACYLYKMINLKCVEAEGYLNKENIEEYESALPLKTEYGIIFLGARVKRKNKQVG